MTSRVYTTTEVDAHIAAVQSLLGGKADTASLAPVATTGDYASLTGKPSIPASATDIGAVPATRTVNGKALSSDVTLAKSDIGLSAVDNTSDANKPVSTAQQAEINKHAAVIRYNTAAGAWPLRSTVTSDTSVTVWWDGPISAGPPANGGGYAVAGVDRCLLS